MATRTSIEFDYKNALAQADKVDGIADSLNAIVSRRLQETLQNLSVSWKGDNANAYIKKGSKLKGNVNNTAGELHSIAEDIRVIAKRIYDAEMAALAVAEERTYEG
jgi:WXG100 family type VII secretion target